MNDELAEKLKYLRLGGLSEHWDEYLKLAALIDRLTESSHIINMKGCISLRAKRKHNT